MEHTTKLHPKHITEKFIFSTKIYRVTILTPGDKADFSEKKKIFFLLIGDVAYGQIAIFLDYNIFVLLSFL